MTPDETFVIVGAGGLGCPALLGLVAAGVRRLVIVDPDVVEASNLQRQVLYSLALVGMPKASAAALALRRMSPGLAIVPRIERIEPERADAFVAALPRPCVLLECSDSPALKFAINDACLRHGVPLVIGAALGLRGQAMAVARGRACYRCIYEAPPAVLPTCDAAGVLGPAVGAAGALLAALAVRLGNDPDAAGRLLAVDFLRANVQTLRPEPRSDCPACGGCQPSLSSGPPEVSAAG